MKALAILIGVVLVVALAGGVFIGSGIYDIGADSPHWQVTERVLTMLRKRSVQTRAEQIAAPDLDDPRLIADGAEHYAAMCVGCHLAPGIENSEIRTGLYPKPPVLSEARELKPGNAFWIIKHGIKMSAMPAWGATHDDDSIWAMVAFVHKMPDMTPDQYRELTANKEEEGGHEHGHHQHEHGAQDRSQENTVDADNKRTQDQDHRAAKDLLAAGAAPEAEAVVQAFHNALARGDRTAALAMLADDAKINEDGETQDRANYAEGHLAADIAFLKNAQVKLLSRVSARAGDRAQVASASAIHATARGKPVALRSDESMELRQSGGAWHIVMIRWSSQPLSDVP